MKTKTATKVILYWSLNQTVDLRWKNICRVYAATLSVALVYFTEAVKCAEFVHLWLIINDNFTGSLPPS